MELFFAVALFLLGILILVVSWLPSSRSDTPIRPTLQLRWLRFRRGGKFVWLFHHDGVIRLSVAEVTNFGWVAWHYPQGRIGQVWLQDDGTTKGVSYIEKWAPFDAATKVSP